VLDATGVERQRRGWWTITRAWVSGLGAIGASIMPIISQDNTSAPVLAVAEKAATEFFR
jgi:hypothetical protein